MTRGLGKTRLGSDQRPGNLLKVNKLRQPGEPNRIDSDKRHGRIGFERKCGTWVGEVRLSTARGGQSNFRATSREAGCIAGTEFVTARRVALNRMTLADLATVSAHETVCSRN